MRFDELDQLLRVYEEANDRYIPPGFHVVARLDGRGFTKLTKEQMDYEAPYDVRFRDTMLTAMRSLMERRNLATLPSG
jgi:tRNA(His) 5'-end guanylyltransferase